MNQDYIATVVTAIFATALACMVNLYAPLPDVVRHFNWVIVALGPFLFLAIAMASNPETDGGDQLDFRA